jgi:pimeloyl-ACP methyl ester carboxylesterase
VIDEVVRRFVPGGRDGWSAVGVDEFLRAYMQPRGRAAFYAALRNIYLDEPEGDEGFWTRLRELQNESLFVWGQKDRLVPIAFARHVREALPGAQHVELPCGHVPQLEAPRETHAAIKRFLRSPG